MKIKYPIILILLVSSFLFVSCNKNEQKVEDTNQYSQWNSGSLTLYVDDELSPLVDSIIPLYKKSYPKVTLEVKKVTSREGMALLLNGKAEIVLQGRGFLKDEDSSIKEYNVQLPEPWEFAKDALIFYTNVDNPNDTLNAKDIEDYFANPKLTAKKALKINWNPEFVISSPNSSVYAQFRHYVLKDGKTQRQLKVMPTFDSVKSYVAKNKNAIGIGYLGQVIGDLRFRPIMLGFYDSTGKYITPKVVHQSYIVQGLYPYIVTYRAYLFSERKNVAFWCATFFAREAAVQTFIKNYGLVPGYAKFVLIKED
ncbi:MAG TPA: substrate-binding domain-containing protein [Bacteroidota bacterium]|nr:substrate-binding domain-containing protein [Bacteroidota bacterium]